MNVFDLYAKITLDTKDYEKKLSSAKTTASGLASKLGSGLQGAASLGGSALKTLGSVAATAVSKAADVAKTVAKVSAAAVGAASAGVVALTKGAVDAYGEFEQLSGGAAKIFDGINQSEILWDAAEAYKNLGMNMNQYLAVMNDVGATFAATMGDQAGYETAKTGLKAIADYATGTGKSVDELSGKFTLITRSTSSYQSIADQFSGILPATSADFLEQAQAAGFLSEKYEKLTDVPVAEYQAAVSKMLEKGVSDIGLAGNAADEATKTITGSLQMTKAAWENLVGALASKDADVGYFVDRFVESSGYAAKNLLPVIRRSLSGISTLVKGLAPVIAQEVPKLLTETIPELVQAGADIVVEIAEAIADNADTIAEQAPKLIEALVTSALEVATALWDVGVAFVEEIATAIEEDGDEILQKALDLLYETLTEGLGVSDETSAGIVETLETAFETISDVFDSIQTAIDDVATALEDSGVTWDDVWDGIGTAVEDAGEVISLAIEAVGAIIAWLVEEVATEGTTLNAAWETVKTTFSVACQVMSTALQLIIDLFNGDWKAAWDDAKLLVEQSSTGMEEIFTARFGAIGEKGYEFGLKIGTDLRENLEQAAEWVNEKTDKIVKFFNDKMEQARQAVNNAIEKIKSYFNFEWSLPALKLPHLSVSGSFSLGPPPTVPSFSIQWYKKAMDNAMILNGATIFGAAGNTLLGGGEAGPEVVSGADTLMNMIQKASSYGQERMVALMGEMLDLMADYFPEIIQGMERDVVLDNGTLVGQLTPAIDAELGKIYRRKNR